MLRHLLYVGLVTVLALGCMFYPFMPGGYDPFAVALSMMVQTLGFVGLLLVPIGALWLRSELKTQRHRTTPGSQPTGGRWLRYAALLTSAVVGLAVALAAAMTSGALAVAVLGIWVTMTSRVANAKRSDGGSGARFDPTPLYLTIVPCVLVLARLAFMQGAVDSSRDRAMLGSEPFLRAIEAHRQVHGHYPISLESVHHDYDPPVVGVERYRYERRGDSYNVPFRTIHLSARDTRVRHVQSA